MKETNVWLSPKELQQMLRGSLQWNDVISRETMSKARIRKLDVSISEKQTPPNQAVPAMNLPAKEKHRTSKRLEGQPVIWLLGSVGFLTVSSWFYYVLFAK